MDSSYRKSVEAENVSAFSPKKVKIRCGCRAQLNTADGVNLLWMHEGKWGGFTLQVRNSRLGIELGECNPKFCGQQAQLRNLLKWIPSDRFINGRKIRGVSQDAKLLPHNVKTYCNFSVFLLDVR